MKCLKKNKIFDYLNEELNGEEKKNVIEHLEKCEKCRNKQMAVQDKIQLVKEKLDLLESMNIPEKSFVIPAEKSISEQSVFKKIRFSSPPILNWKSALAVSTVFLCLIFGFLLKHKTKPNYEEMFLHVVAMEQSFMSDAKADYNENAFYISSFDEEKKQVEIIRTSNNGETISQKKFP